MGNLLSWKEVNAQSKQVYAQFGEKKWKPYAKINAALPHGDSFGDFKNAGVGKFLLCVGMGASLENQIDVIKKYRDRVDIVVCDKGFKPLLERGVKADYVMICDCNIMFEHIGDAIKETKGVKLLATPYAKPAWTTRWLGERYYFINRDSIESEKIFEPTMGPKARQIPAGSNVSNAMIAFFCGADEYNKINYTGYEKYILIGYDYSWQPKGNYYAWKDPKPKRHYMHHRTIQDFKGNIVFSSENLCFSARWLYLYATTFNLPLVNCAERGLLDIPYKNPLEAELKAINPDKKAYENCRNIFEAYNSAFATKRKMERMFDNARSGLYVGMN